MAYRLRLGFSLFFILVGCAGPETRPQVEARVVFKPWGVIGAKVSDTYQGILVDHLLAESAAKKAGLLIGDRILKVNGNGIGNTEALLDDIRARIPGELLEVEIQRRGKRLSLEVRVEAFPLDEQLYLMASSALEAWDRLRAKELYVEYRERFGPENRLWKEMERIGASL